MRRANKGFAALSAPARIVSSPGAQSAKVAIDVLDPGRDNSSPFRPHQIDRFRDPTLKAWRRGATVFPMDSS
jgi:hypothetical protein